MDDAFATVEQNKLRNSSGNFAITDRDPPRLILADQLCLPLAEASSPPLPLGFWCDARHSA
jgi:hypothetical protein